MGGAGLKAVVSLVMMTLITCGILYYKQAAPTSAVPGVALESAPTGHADVAKSGGINSVATRGRKVITMAPTRDWPRDANGAPLPRFKVIARRGVTLPAASEGDA